MLLLALLPLLQMLLLLFGDGPLTAFGTIWSNRGDKAIAATLFAVDCCCCSADTADVIARVVGVDDRAADDTTTGTELGDRSGGPVLPNSGVVAAATTIDCTADATNAVEADGTVVSPTTDDVDAAEDPPDDELVDDTSDPPLPFADAPPALLLVEKEYSSTSVILGSPRHHNFYRYHRWCHPKQYYRSRTFHCCQPLLPLQHHNYNRKKCTK